VTSLASDFGRCSKLRSMHEGTAVDDRWGGSGAAGPVGSSAAGRAAGRGGAAAGGVCVRRSAPRPRWPAGSGEHREHLEIVSFPPSEGFTPRHREGQFGAVGCGALAVHLRVVDPTRLPDIAVDDDTSGPGAGVLGIRSGQGERTLGGPSGRSTARHGRSTAPGCGEHSDDRQRLDGSSQLDATSSAPLRFRAGRSWRRMTTRVGDLRTTSLNPARS
jgi:hypothetical protein